MKPARICGLVVAVLFLLTAFVTAQTVHQVAAGIDGIKAALATCASGDIIELTSAFTGTEYYIEQDNDTIWVDVTIRAQTGLATKPVIANSGSNTFVVYKGSLTLQGVKFDNAPGGVLPTWGGNMVYINTAATGTTASPNFNLKVDKCEFANWAQHVRAITSSDATGTPLDSVLITNTVFRNRILDSMNHSPIYMKTTRTGSMVFPGCMRYFLMENCLVLRVGCKVTGSDGYATYIEPGNRGDSLHPYPTVIVNHVTVDSCGGGINTYTTSGALVKNCIVTSWQDTSVYAYALESGRWIGAPGTNLMNSLYFNPPPQTRPHIYLGNSAYTLATLTNVSEADPMFNDPTTGDYSLKAGSPGKGAGTDGKDLGYIASGLTDVKQIDNRIPESFQLSQNFPNPFNPSTTMEFSVPKGGHYTIKIFNMLGQEVATAFDQEVAPGSYSVWFDARKLASGHYIYELKGSGAAIAKRMTLLK